MRQRGKERVSRGKGKEKEEEEEEQENKKNMQEKVTGNKEMRQTREVVGRK